MNIEYLNPDALTPYERNAKKHPAEQVNIIANSIKEFGFRQPIVIDKDNVVVIGHGRLLAAQKLKLSEVPCVRADDLSTAQINALRLADNKTNESEWDFSLLEAELEDLELVFDMTKFGFDDTGNQSYAGESAIEYSPEDFADDKFKHECPKCGFRFND